MLKRLLTSDRMKKQLVIFGIAVLLICIGFSGCNEDNNTFQSDEEKIIGTWVFATTLNETTVYVYYIFLTNKTFEVIFSYAGEVIRENGTWNITDNKLLITLKGEIITSDYNFSNNNKTLTIIESNGIKSIFTKQ